MLEPSSTGGSLNMQELLGRTFAVADGRYRVVDVRKLSGEAMVYAEPIDMPDGGKPRPQRMAFHYGDIADLVEPAADPAA